MVGCIQLRSRMLTDVLRVQQLPLFQIRFILMLIALLPVRFTLAIRLKYIFQQMVFIHREIFSLRSFQILPATLRARFIWERTQE